jgi:hypothetical protein
MAPPLWGGPFFLEYRESALTWLEFILLARREIKGTMESLSFVGRHDPVYLVKLRAESQSRLSSSRDRDYPRGNMELP